ncbi:MAG: PepSY-associated TM helix domain-containing protein [Methylobacter sp.]|uniref:PepSY-associated TM helix domain-containing protein n=1 Tax=Methylobacter sp. TaxID=2051955 RepID=UPI0025D152B6|nr:PepSY-associated TM helix domain-containing protein [Methylobacter sp.]MCK9620743.1 PepSY-associated TM helix domain-containing protein [Methylobacter sp.]
MTQTQNPETVIRQPKRIQWLKWLRRVHAWVGLWGAALGLLFGVSGILLNHHMVMKIPAAKMERSQIELPLPTPLPVDAEALALWLQTQLNISREPSKVITEPAKTVTWAGQTFQQPGQWRVDFHSPQQSVNAEYWVGNSFVSVKRQDANIFAFITRLHKGVGMGTAWILLADTLAGGLVFLSLTGLLLWTKLHGSRLLMAGLGLVSLGLGVSVVLNSL